MDVVSFAVVLVVLAVFVAAPLYRRAAETGRAEDTDEPAETVLDALGELEVDRESGLVDERSYDQEKAALEDRLPRRSRD